MGRVTTRVPAERVDVTARRRLRRPDTLVVEEPLEVRVGAAPVVVTMRTPGDDVDLALGFLLTEGLLDDPDDVATAVHCTDLGEDGRPTFNVLEVALRPGVPPPDADGRRTFGMTSACGVCGSASIDAVARRSRHDVAADPVTVDAAVLAGLPDRLRAEQRTFDRTGGLHAAGLFRPDGEPLVVREDVGRHNAVDKVTGARVLAGQDPAVAALVVSGRAGFELVQKAVAAGVGALVAVGAPTSLSVSLATRSGLGLYGFTRASRTVRYA
jgi:FdhD protein